MSDTPTPPSVTAHGSTDADRPTTDPAAPRDAASLQFLILTGMSGAGKSNALKCLEDIGYFCVDNLPVGLLSSFADLCERGASRVQRVAIVADVRERLFLDHPVELAPALRARGHRVETLFFDADDAVLIRRFSETRRPHPLSPDGSVTDGLRQERTMLASLQQAADRYVDTSAFSVHDLKAHIQRQYGDAGDDGTLTISVLAFGFKHGVPPDADLIFDVRFLNNPHFVPELRPHTGETPPVRDYVLSDPRAGRLLDHLEALLAFTLPEYEREGRAYLTIGVGCTGGRHRSVVIARELVARIQAMGRPAEIRLRDAHGPQSNTPRNPKSKENAA